MVFAQTAFVLQNPDKQDDHLAEYEAGVEDALRTYEVLLNANPQGPAAVSRRPDPAARDRNAIAVCEGARLRGLHEVTSL
jgi:hypothetical protein